MDPLSVGLGIGKMALGVFGQRADRRRQEKAQKNKFRDLRKAAQRGGFNPLTALQYTGGAGFGSGTGAASAPPLASTQLMLDGFQGVSDELTGKNALERQERQLNIDLKQIALEQGRAALAAPSIAAQPGAARIGNQADQEEAQTLLDMREPEGTNPSRFRSGSGQSWIDSRNPNAEAWEDRHGELAGSVAGLGVAFRDFVMTTRMRSVVSRHGMDVAQRIYDEYSTDFSQPLGVIIRKHTPKRLPTIADVHNFDPTEGW